MTHSLGPGTGLAGTDVRVTVHDLDLYLDAGQYDRHDTIDTIDTGK